MQLSKNARASEEWPALHCAMHICIRLQQHCTRRLTPACANMPSLLGKPSMNVIVLKLFCTSGLAIYAKVVQRLLWKSRSAALLEVTHLQGCSKPRAELPCCSCPPLRRGVKRLTAVITRDWTRKLKFKSPIFYFEKGIEIWNPRNHLGIYML